MKFITFLLVKIRVFQINVVKLLIDKAYDLSYYQYLIIILRSEIRKNISEMMGLRLS